ncbi:DUF1553 domain-containing protein [Roseimaritima ulvae]|nr:DUF1553 domain-containing protein [Roseimaritima ulvae]
MSLARIFAIAVRCAAGLSLLWLGTARAEDFFTAQVAPLLESHCLNCHNDATSKGDFSLHTRASAMAEGYIEPGDADNSHLIELVTPLDGSAAMPQDAPPLSVDQIATLKKWIDDGAVWPEGLSLQEPHVEDFDWWSYQPIVRPPVPQPPASPSPQTSPPNWVRTPIDAFILQKLMQKGLSPSPEADRRTLIRRLSFDLTGLPPTPEQVAAFVSDPDSQAYEHLVDRLLASKHYGEHWARHWLDVAKYADTCGYDKDRLRPNAWPYRDYVIRSFNNDKPYTRFVQEQIAGDVLFPGEPDGILGLGFIAAGPWDFIGHVEVPESKIDGKVARNLDRDDMVAGTFNTFCSLTVQCARCHHHKFDPITQPQYYGLQAVFAAVDRAERVYDTDPQTEARRRELESQLQQARQELAALDKEIATAGGTQLAELQTQLAELDQQLKVRKEAEFGYHSQIAAEADTPKWVEVQLHQVTDISRVVLHPCHDDFADIGAGFGFPVRFRVEVSRDGESWQPIADHTSADVPNPGLRPFEISDVNVTGDRIRVTATRLAERKNDYILALAEIEVFEVLGPGDGDAAPPVNLAGNATVAALDSIEAPPRWRRDNLTDGQWARLAIDETKTELVDILQRRDAIATERDTILKAINTPQRVRRREAAQAAFKQAQQSLAALPQGKVVYAAATHFPRQGNFIATEGKPRTVHILNRGNVQQPEEVATPGAIPLGNGEQWTFAADLPEQQRRAALATWLTNSQHPLLWRSIVNRVWQYHFGTGIVSTPNDFGRMGATPTHPQLLDWLATEFRDNGQSFKSLHRMIVTSSVYRQASTFNPAAAEVDGSNQYYWRMNRRRLTAEEIRDSILMTSGALDTKMGGPGYYLFKLEQTAHSPHYEYHKFDPADPASHRRSIYRFIARSQPNPWMTVLDCADSSQSTPKRNETLTALQALSLLNSRFNLTMSERFAKRLESEQSTLPKQVRRAVSLLVQRELEADQQQQLVAYAQDHGLPNLCRMLFNLSEFVYVD